MTQQVNLYQQPGRRARMPLDARQLAMLTAVWAVLLALVSGHATWQRLQAESRVATLAAEQTQVQSRLQRLSAEIDRARATDHAERIAAIESRIEQRQQTLRDLDARPDSERAGFSAELEGLARRVVDGLWLTSIGIRDGGRRLHLAGRATHAERIPGFIESLAEEPAFHGHRFQTLTIERPEAEPGAVEFVLASRTGAAPERRGQR